MDLQAVFFEIFLERWNTAAGLTSEYSEVGGQTRRRWTSASHGGAIARHVNV